jgi:hypothetical protein
MRIPYKSGIYICIYIRAHVLFSSSFSRYVCPIDVFDFHSDRPSIAVLPFDNWSGDPDQAHFSDGLTKEVMTELSCFRELVVIARGSSAAFGARDRDVREVGRQLGASYLVEGSVRRAANRVRISAQIEGLLREARRLDPTFARAYSGLAYITVNRSLDSGARPH